MRGKPLVLVKNDSGCIVPLSHILNQEGYEIDHLCHNRACCNIEHLQCIPRLEHLVKHNSTRYADRFEAAKQYWLEHKEITGTRLAEIFGVSFGTACKWVRKWKVQRLSLME